MLVYVDAYSHASVNLFVLSCVLPCAFYHERLSCGLKDYGESKSHSGLKFVSDSCTDNLIFPAILALRGRDA